MSVERTETRILLGYAHSCGRYYVCANRSVAALVVKRRALASRRPPPRTVSLRAASWQPPDNCPAYHGLMRMYASCTSHELAFPGLSSRPLPGPSSHLQSITMVRIKPARFLQNPAPLISRAGCTSRCITISAVQTVIHKSPDGSCAEKAFAP